MLQYTMTPALKYFEKKCEPSGFPPQAIDSLEMSIAYSSTQDILNVFATLGVACGQGKRPEFIQGHPIEQPGHCEIFGVKVCIWCSDGRIRVLASPGSYDVTEEHYRNAAIIEANIDQRARSRKTVPSRYEVQKSFESSLKAIACPRCKELYTNDAVAWCNGWIEGRQDLMAENGEQERDGPVCIRCEHCGSKSAINIFTLEAALLATA